MLFAVLGAACGQSNTLKPPPPPDAPADEQAAGQGADERPRSPIFPRTGINTGSLTVTGIAPRSGPFSGGNRAVVRGSGFSDDAIVRVGGRMVQPRDTLMVDRNSLSIVVPAGEVGPADVSVTIGDGSATRERAYTYNALRIEPSLGAIAGGTLVEITAAAPIFDEPTLVEFDGEPCVEQMVITPSALRCKTPAGRAGTVDVTARFFDGLATRETLTASDAFEYVDPTNTDVGGLSGGPIEGTVNITVLNADLGLVVPDAFVMLGEDLSTLYQGRTDSRGQITFSGDGLQGPVTLHVAGYCLEKSSIVAFDARNVTVYVAPLMDPSCAMPDGGLGGGRPTAGSFISGELIFPGSDEFAINAWDVIPPALPDELRVTYVATTRSKADSPNPPTEVGAGTLARVVEVTAPIGVRGYPYAIFARPAGLAVYAVSGLERLDTGEFTPYVMGIARDVLTAPGEETAGIDIYMDIPLDRELKVQLSGIPQGTAVGPEQFRVAANLDLGGEGIIVREHNDDPFDLLTSFTGGGAFRFFAQPALVGSLADARYRVVAGWYTGDPDGDGVPYTEARIRGLSQPSDAVQVDGFLDIPRSPEPAEGAQLPEDRVLRWQMADPAPDLYVVKIWDGDATVLWTQYVPGTQTETPIPDLSSIEDVDDVSTGVLYWEVRAAQVPGLVYDELTYDSIASSLWSRSSSNRFVAQHR